MNSQENQTSPATSKCPIQSRRSTKPSPSRYVPPSSLFHPPPTKNIKQNPSPSFTLTTLPLPPLAPTDILVKLSATSVCSTDLALATGQLGPCRPVLGHEGVGRVARLGSLVSPDEVRVGQRVGVSWVRGVCGECVFCLRGGGRDGRCARKWFSGREVDGTFAGFTVVRGVEGLVRLPDDVEVGLQNEGVGDGGAGDGERERGDRGQRPLRTPTPSDEVLAPIMCAGVTAYKALKECGATPGGWVAISGAGGGVGALGVQYARAMGYRVLALDVGGEKKALCGRLGAEVCIDVQDYETGQEVADAAKRATDGDGVEAVVVAAGTAQAYQDALGMLAPYGTMVCVGIPSPSSRAVQFHPLMFIDRGIRVIGSMVGSKGDIYEAVRFVQRGLVKPEVTVVGMEELGQVMNLLASGQVSMPSGRRTCANCVGHDQIRCQTGLTDVLVRP